jgi:outer membrane protein
MKQTKCCRIVVLAIFCAWPIAIHAQAVKSLSLQQAVELALRNNRRLQATAQQREAASSVVGQAQGAFFPRVDIIEAFNYTDKPTLVFSNLLDQASFTQKNFAIGSLNEPTPLTNLSSQIRLEQPLYSGGRLSANLSQAEAAAEASRELTKRTEQEVMESVIEAYHHVLLAEGNLGVVHKALESARAQAARSQDLYEKGLAVRADYLRTEVLLGSLERERLEAQNLVTINHSRLRHVLGAEDEKFHLTDEITEDSAPLDSLADLKARARAQRPDLRAALKDVEGSQASIQAARAAHYPSLEFVSQFESNTRRFSGSAENFAVFVTARWNLFNGFAVQEKVVQEEALHRRARLLHDDLLRAVELEVEQSYLGLLTARRQVVVARENVTQAREALRMTTDRYSAGLARNVDVLDGETALKKAEQDLLVAQVNSHIYRARLNLATGGMR